MIDPRLADEPFSPDPAPEAGWAEWVLPTLLIVICFVFPAIFAGA